MFSHRRVERILANDHREARASYHRLVATVTPKDVHHALGLPIRSLEIVGNLDADEAERPIIDRPARNNLMLRPGESRLNGIPNALVVNELVVRANGATNGKVVVIRNNLTTITLDQVALVVNEVQVSNAHGVENPAVAEIGRAHV